MCLFLLRLPVRIAAYEAVEKLLERLASPLLLKVSPTYSAVETPAQTTDGGGRAEEPGSAGQSSTFTTISNVPLFDYNVCILLYNWVIL